MLKWLIPLVIIGGLVVAAVVFFNPFASDEADGIIAHEVSRRSVRDMIVERGTLESQNTIRGACPLPGWENKIIFIVPEGDRVKNGDVVVRFDSEKIDERIAQMKNEVNKAEGAVQESKQEIEVQKNTNESNIEAAKLAVALADLDLKKYRDGDFEAEQADFKRSIDEGKAELEKIKDELENIRALVKKGYRAPEQLREIQLRYDSARFRVSRDELKLTNLVKFDRPRRIMELEANAEETVRKLTRAEDTATAELEKAKAKLENSKQALELQNDEMKQLEELSKNTEMKATAEGTLVYANKPWYDDDERIREGLSVYQNQEIFYLPDMRNMQVNVSVHESVVNKVKVGQKATIRVSTYPDVNFIGTIKRVSSLASSNYRTSTKNYEVVIFVDEFPVEIELRPGMTAECEIMAGVYQDIIAVPVNAVTEHFQQNYVYVIEGKKVIRQRVEIGRATTSFLEITKGLQVGQRLALDAYQRGLNDFGEAEKDAGLAEGLQNEKPAAVEGAAPSGGNPG